jgi:hypothetical protein
VTEPGSGSSATTAAAARALRSKNHLQELVWILEEIPEFVALGAESLGSKLRGHLDSRHGGIFRNVANLVDLDTRFTGERGFQLFCERGGLCVSAGKSAHESRELGLRQSRGKVDAGNPRAH